MEKLFTTSNHSCLCAIHESYMRNIHKYIGFMRSIFLSYFSSFFIFPSICGAHAVNFSTENSYTNTCTCTYVDGKTRRYRHIKHFLCVFISVSVCVSVCLQNVEIVDTVAIATTFTEQILFVYNRYGECVCCT